MRDRDRDRERERERERERAQERGWLCLCVPVAVCDTQRKPEKHIKTAKERTAYDMQSQTPKHMNIITIQLSEGTKPGTLLTNDPSGLVIHTGNSG